MSPVRPSRVATSYPRRRRRKPTKRCGASSPPEWAHLSCKFRPDLSLSPAYRHLRSAAAHMARIGGTSMSETALRSGMLVFPNMTQLDLTGPYEIFARLPGAETLLLWKTLEPVRSEHGLTILPM